MGVTVGSGCLVAVSEEVCIPGLIVFTAESRCHVHFFLREAGAESYLALTMVSLWDIDYCAGYRPGHDHAVLGFTLHQVTGNACGGQVCTVDINTPKLLDTVEGVCNGIEFLGEARRIDEVVNLSLILVDLCG